MRTPVFGLAVPARSPNASLPGPVSHPRPFFIALVFGDVFRTLTKDDLHVQCTCFYMCSKDSSACYLRVQRSTFNVQRQRSTMRVPAGGGVPILANVYLGSTF